MIGQAQTLREARHLRWATLSASTLGAGWVVAALLATPAAALDTSWKSACTFPMAPQGYIEMMRERVCLDQNYCQKMADAQGSPYTGNGCFMVAPSVAAEQRQQPRSGYAKR
ncbi:hypothetical protein [Bosea sp. Tri-44]|uniref:hypothetical protein n=1 Tax=Bosea sp. Tri-44 TaxID=1972137 RepID=UPI00100E2124|nr:hypothetical protein [Bosea sp. Tri-44]